MLRLALRLRICRNSIDDDKCDNVLLKMLLKLDTLYLFGGGFLFIKIQPINVD